MERASWKQVERKIASLLGGVRIPVTGRRGPDIEHEWLSIEVKARRRLPIYLWNWICQAEDGPPEKLPIVVLHREGEQHLKEDLVFLRLSDFIDWFVGEESDERD